MNSCRECGAPLVAGSNYCHACGQPVAELLLSKRPRQSGFSTQQLAQSALRARAFIRTSSGSGSGFFCAPSGLVVTNYHVIASAAEILVRVPGGREFPVEQVVAGDRHDDVAVLKVNIPADFQPQMLELGDSRQLQVGDRVLAVGNPVELEGTVSEGIVSAMRPEIGRVQMTAPISRGSSGGPVLNSDGQVVGIAVASIGGDGTQNLNLMVPAELIAPYLSAREVGWKLVRELSSKAKSRVTAARIAPDRQSLYSATADGTICRWGFETGKLLKQAERARRVLDLAFLQPRAFVTVESAEGDPVVHCCRWDSDKPQSDLSFALSPGFLPDTVSLQRSALKGRIEGGPVSHVLALAGRHRDSARVALLALTIGFGGKTSAPCASFGISGKPRFVEVDWSSDPATQLMAVCLDDGKLQFVKCATGEVLRRVQGVAPLTVVRFRPDGMGVVLADKIGTIWEWTAFSLRNAVLAPKEVAKHGCEVSTLSLDERGEFAVTGGVDGTVKVWRREKLSGS